MTKLWQRGGVWVIALLAAMPSGAQPVAAAHELAGVWRIDQALTEPMYDRRQARLDFGAAGRLGGHTSCNGLSAAYSLDGTRLQIGLITTTRNGCSRLQLEQEDRILGALEQASSAHLRSDGLLELRAADGRALLRGSRLQAAE